MGCPGQPDIAGSSPALPSSSGFAAERHFSQNAVERAFRRFVAAQAARCLSRPAGDLAIAMGCPGRPGFGGVVSRVAELRLFCRRAACRRNAVKRAFRRCVAARAARSPRPVAPRPWGPRAAPSPPRTRAGSPLACPVRGRPLPPLRHLGMGGGRGGARANARPEGSGEPRATRTPPLDQRVDPARCCAGTAGLPRAVRRGHCDRPPKDLSPLHLRDARRG